MHTVPLPDHLLQVQIVQNVVVELQYRDVSPGVPSSKRPGGPFQRSVYTGWTGMASMTKSVPIAERTGRKAKEEVGMVEIDATFGRMLGLADGQKVIILQPSGIPMLR